MEKLWRWIARVSQIISIGGILVLVWQIIIIPHFFPSVTILCSPKIYSHEQVVFGNYSPAREGYQVRVYVYPEDKTNKYWLQDQTWETTPNGTWADLARFGNPWGIDMKKPPPLNFRVFAVLIKSEDVIKLPAFGQQEPWIIKNSDKDFLDSLMKAGAKAVSTPYKLERLPEDICHSIPNITSINKKEYITMRMKPLNVASPVRLHWEPNIPMYVEVRKGGVKILGDYMGSDVELPLEPGTQEIKVKPKDDYYCSASIWLDVSGR